MARPQINIRVDEERKERWKQAAEESPEYDGLTHLIRLAVEQELAEGGSTGSSPEGGEATLDEESSDLLREVKGTTERVEGGVEDVKARLHRLEERVGQSGPEFSLRAAVRETVPEGSREDGLTVRQIAARLNADRGDVSDALDSLEEEGEVRPGPGGEDGSNEVWFRPGGL
ncbi:helix-turn-helix domain-containing protein [Haloarculaceae archaeon H-GB1-1]|nr:helix-turn-helix domain-containing protein [Haloarculaceae archaeon H-GB1-1]